MKVSILGSNGFLSTAIARYAREVGWKLHIFGLTLPVNYDYDNFTKIDFSKSKMDIKSLLDSDIVIYAVGAGIQSNLCEDTSLVYNLNVTVPIDIATDLEKFDYKGIFVTFGSVFEMGETKKRKLFSEEDIISSQSFAPNDYVVSKRLLTRFVTSYHHHFTHWHFIIPTIYGKGENPHRLIPYVINSIKKGDKLQFTSGEQTRQYIHVSEIPRIIELSYFKYLPSGIYNIEGKETLTVKEIVSIIHREMNTQVPENCFGAIQRVDSTMRYLALDGRKLKSFIGFCPQVSIEETISDY